MTKNFHENEDGKVCLILLQSCFHLNLHKIFSFKRISPQLSKFLNRKNKKYLSNKVKQKPKMVINIFGFYFWKKKQKYYEIYMIFIFENMTTRNEKIEKFRNQTDSWPFIFHTPYVCFSSLAKTCCLFIWHYCCFILKGMEEVGFMRRWLNKFFPHKLYSL